MVIQSTTTMSTSKEKDRPQSGSFLKFEKKKGPDLVKG